jgi:hypothetical protein
MPDESIWNVRAELLDLLEALFPGKTWPPRVRARGLATFAVGNLPDTALHWFGATQHTEAVRALQLADAILSRTRP